MCAGVVYRVCVDAVIGRLSGAGERVCVYQCHTRASAGSNCLDLIISPGVCSALPPVTYSGTIT